MAALAAELRPIDQDTDDLDLVEGVRAGDDRAFEMLYARYQPRIGLYIRGMVQDDGRAEDITQDVFISALRRMRETDREIAFKRWIYEIAKNACIDAYRRSRHTNEISFDVYDAIGADEHGRLADARATPDIAVDTKLQLDNLRGAFGSLSETHHQILVMRELEGLSYRDIGERLGMTRPAVESTLFRARRRLEEEFDELVSGKRCARVRDIIDGGGHAPGLRDQRRLDRHISHCQLCRRHALMAGIDLEGRRARPSVAARIAALLPLPALLRRTGAAQWSANMATTVDPATAGGWGKAIAAAATVAVAGMGAGAAVRDSDGFGHFVSRGQAIVGFGSSSDQLTQGRSAARQPDVPGRGGTSGLSIHTRAHVGTLQAGRTPSSSSRSSSSSSQSPGGTVKTAPSGTKGGLSRPSVHPGPGSAPTPGPGGPGAGQGGSGGGPIGGGVLGGQSAADGTTGGAPDVSPVVQGLTTQLGGTLTSVVGQSSGALNQGGSTLGQLSGITGAVTSTATGALAGM